MRRVAQAAQHIVRQDLPNLLEVVNALAEGDLKPSFKPGDSVKPFSPYNVTGTSAGKDRCQV